MIPVLANELDSIFNSKLPSPDAIAARVSNGVNLMLSAAIILGGVYGTGPITGMDVGSLRSQLSSIFIAKYNNDGMIGTRIASAIKLFAVSGTCFGTAIPPAVPPQIGPLS